MLSLLCNFHKTESGTCKCQRCERELKVNDCDTLRAECKAEPCIHFAGPTGDSTETHKHCGCKTATPMTALAECDLHGTCTFIGQAKDERIPFCGDCQDYRQA